MGDAASGLSILDPTTASAGNVNDDNESNDMAKMPTVKIRDEASSREITTKNGKKEVFFQPVQVECDQFRINIDMDIDTKADAKKVGEVYSWDVYSDLVPGAYSSVDLSRRMTLVPLQK